MYSQDGFTVSVELTRRLDTRTAASLLQSYLEAVKPPGIEGLAEVVLGIRKWAAKVAVLLCRHKEELNGNLSW